MGEGWDIAGQRWAQNPRLVLPEWVWPVVDLWFTCRRFSSPYAPPPMPCPGSAGEQPAALLDAFALLDAPEKTDG